MGRKRQMVEVRPRTVWGHCQGLYASQRESGAYQMPMVPGVVGGHLMQWWENSRRRRRSSQLRPSLPN